MAEQDFLDVLAEMMFAGDSELAQRLAEQDEILRQLPCRDESVGRLVMEYDLEHLYAALGLGDEDFAARFPEMRHLARGERERLALTIRNHVPRCPRCARKEGFELEWSGSINRACRENGESLRRLLREESRAEAEAAKEGEGYGDSALGPSTTG
ncbi:MAG TPA: hypothetical protein VGB98_06165 [Pyrinomonadaceae bacterium]|jgi:hypothetical protein